MEDLLELHLPRLDHALEKASLFAVVVLLLGLVGDEPRNRALWSLTLPSFILLLNGATFGTIVCVLLPGAWLGVMFLHPTWAGSPALAAFGTRFVGADVTILFLAGFTEQARRPRALHPVSLTRPGTATGIGSPP